MILVVDPDQPFRSHIASELGRGTLLEAAGLADLKRSSSGAGTSLSVVILGPNLNPVEAIAAVDSLHLDAQGVSVLLIASTVTPDVLPAALRSGVKDVLAASFSRSDLLESVSRAEGLARQTQTARPIDEPQHPRRLATGFSTKGGCGKSVVASNVAVLLAPRCGPEGGLGDLDLGSGDLSIMLGLLPAWTVYDAAEQLGR